MMPVGRRRSSIALRGSSSSSRRRRRRPAAAGSHMIMAIVIHGLPTTTTTTTTRIGILTAARVAIIVAHLPALEAMTRWTAIGRPSVWLLLLVVVVVLLLLLLLRRRRRLRPVAAILRSTRSWRRPTTGRRTSLVVGHILSIF